jgi:hypothetical protein
LTRSEQSSADKEHEPDKSATVRGGGEVTGTFSALKFQGEKEVFFHLVHVFLAAIPRVSVLSL